MLKSDQISPEINQLLQKGVALHKQGLFSEAQAIYEQILKIQPNHFDAMQLLGTIAIQAKNYEQCVELLTQALEVKTNYAPAYFNLGIALYELRKFDEAIQYYKKAITINPNYIAAHHALAKALKRTNQFEAAIAYYDRAISLNPLDADAYLNKGAALQELKSLDEALKSYDRAISLNPENPDAYLNRGTTLQELSRLDEALESYDKAISLNPGDAGAHHNRGAALQGLSRLDEALDSYEKAISLSPDDANAYVNRGAVLKDLSRLNEALISYKRAIQLKPEMDYLLGNLIYTKMHLCDWDSMDILINELIEKTLQHQKTSVPFTTLALIDHPELQKCSAETFIKSNQPINQILPLISKYPAHQKIRIGYFSADFHNHATMHLMAEMFEYHDKSKFELIAFSFGPDQWDEWRQKAISSFDQFLDVRTKSDIEITSIARKLKIDIAVDLKGFTANERKSIFAHRAAPIQVNYLGYPGTMGAEYIDYIIADTVLIPEDKQQHYSEKIVYLPDSYQVNVKGRLISNKSFSRKEAGLPNDAFVFCSFNNNYKITPATFDRWMRILQAVEGSVLWIFKTNDTATENLKNEAELRGINKNRLVFASFVPVEEHLKRIQLADLFLDTLPYNAHTTGSDALRVGLPILTLMGESFASRVAASLLNAVGLPELITTNQNAYESLAIELATQPNKLGAIRNKLVNNLPSSPLFNPKLFTEHLESAYQVMYQRYQDDLPPDHIKIT